MSQEEFAFAFLDNSCFSVETASDKRSAGTYSSRLDGMGLSFSSDEIFSIEGKTLALGFK